MWARIHDVPAALSARRYPVDQTVVIEVRDPLEHCSGRWRLEVTGGEAGCEATGDEPDLSLDVDALSGLWLGGGDGVPGVEDLCRAGRSQAADPAAAGRVAAPPRLTDRTSPRRPTRVAS